jgi:hypothetical protein
MDNQELQQSAATASALQCSFSPMAQLVIYSASTTAAIIPLPNTHQLVYLKLSNTNFFVLEDADETISFGPRRVFLC